LETGFYGTHTMRRTEASLDLPANPKPEGCTASSRPYEAGDTARYLGIEVDDALEIAEQIDI